MFAVFYTKVHDRVLRPRSPSASRRPLHRCASPSAQYQIDERLAAATLPRHSLRNSAQLSKL